MLSESKEAGLRFGSASKERYKINPVFKKNERKYGKEGPLQLSNREGNLMKR